MNPMTTRSSNNANRTTAARRRAAIVAATGLAVLAGCSAPASHATPPTTGQATTPSVTRATASPPATDPASYVSAPCPDPNLPGWPQGNLGPNFTCGYLTVPEDRGKPDGRTIRLTVARVKAASATPQPDPIVYLEGGPGLSALFAAPSNVLRGINADRDVIFVD